MANDDGPDLSEKVTDVVGNGNGGGTIGSTLKSKELLIPAALSAAGAIVAAKAPGLVRKLSSATEQKGHEEAEQMGQHAVEGAKKSLGGGSGGVAGKVLSKVMGGGGGGEGGGKQKKTRRLPIQRWTDVAVPVEKAYSEWIKFDQFPSFMHRVLSVTQEEGEDKVQWQEKIWFSKRQWEGKITDRRKNDRIAWKTTSGMSHSGVVSFHPIGDRLTRVMVTLDFQPTGMFEKMASGLRFVKRAVQADLARFKAHVEMEDARGLEYSVKRGEDKKDDDKNEDDKKNDGNGSRASRGRSAQGSTDDSDEGDAEKDADREERESRRRQRRESTDKPESREKAEAS